MYTIKLNPELISSLNKGYIKTIDIVLFLILQGFKTDKDTTETALKDLSFEGKKIKKALFKNDSIIIKF